eukprot:TRINITY_DN426_c0_g1_i4.p1 TRINITY_DN426_c0_g1~~TRINITY_DN426_c0_g1_i4.p1  ORF type:complete len:273 (+),score=56.98 TRINITY_DN426_c0_g1_i4:1178-1996(+)
MSSQILDVKVIEKYSGVALDLSGVKIDGDLTVYLGEFDLDLKARITQWKQNAKTGVWAYIPPDKSDFLPILVKNGFKYYHASEDRVIMGLWLVDGKPSKLPKGPRVSTKVLVFVKNDLNQVLMVKEKYLTFGWKLPGGGVDIGEDLGAAAVREVKEETGILTEYQSIISISEIHNATFGFDQLVVTVRAKLQSSNEITVDKEELMDAKWISIDELLKMDDLLIYDKELLTTAKRNDEITNGNPELREMTTRSVISWLGTPHSFLSTNGETNS